MEYRINYQPRALKEYEDAANWYRERSQQAAEEFVQAMEDCLSVLHTQPDRFRKTYKEFRLVNLKNYPYCIIDLREEKDKKVIISSVFH